MRNIGVIHKVIKVGYREIENLIEEFYGFKYDIPWKMELRVDEITEINIPSKVDTDQPITEKSYLHDIMQNMVNMDIIPAGDYIIYG